MLKKIKDIVIYQDKKYYSAFPAVQALPDGKIIASFRRAPNYHGLPGIADDYCKHGDILSQYMSVVSEDNGETWSKPNLIYSPSEGCSQDAGLFYDGKYLYANSFIWTYVPDVIAEELKKTGTDEYLHKYLTYMVPGGSYVMRSSNSGKTWEGPLVPEPLPGGKEVLPGHPLRLHNRGNICKLADGTLLLAGQVLGFRPEFHSSIGIYCSKDQGKSWQYHCIAADDKGIAVFEEPSLNITPSGKWVVLIRCHREFDGTRKERAEMWIAESTDKGKTWSVPRYAGFHSEPATACQLSNGKVLVVTGHRIEPYGVRARICDPEFNDIGTAEEHIIRDDAAFRDTGYPGITPLGNDRYLIVYYINKPSYNGASAIEGSIVEIK